MELLDPNSSKHQLQGLTKGKKVFSLISLILGNLFHDSESLTIERNSLLLDTASRTRLENITKIIALESEVEQKDGRLNILLKGLTIGTSSTQVAFRLFYSFKQEDPLINLKPDLSGHWTLSLPRTLAHQVSPMFLHDSVFSLRLYSTNKKGSKHSIATGRGFLIFESAEEAATH
nr:hypothetical protein 11 [Desulfobulbaceae bacterium]